MRRFLPILLFILPLALSAQKKKKAAPAKAKPQTESREVTKLRDEKSNAQKQLKATEKKLSDTKKDTETKQKHVAYIERQLSERVAYIHRLEQRIDSIDHAMLRLEYEIDVAARNLRKKKFHYGESLRYARTQQLKGGNLGIIWFALQAGTWQQMYRRARYAREYASHQETLGRKIIAQQEELRKKQSLLLKYKEEMNNLLNEISQQRRRLMSEHREQQQVLGGLRSQQKTLTAEIEKQRRRVNELDKKIEQVIAREIELARKRAEEAERKRRAAEEAERKRLAAAGKSTPSKPATTTKKNNTGGAFVTTADRVLSGSFERCKGLLPVPITGPYRIGASINTNTSGIKGVQLTSKGTNYIGKPGACARAIYDGEVTAVFAYGGMTNVLVRHGSYISVYCNLSSVRVHQGQKVKARDLLGAVGIDERGETTLLFQLRHETARLNPEAWIAK